MNTAEIIYDKVRMLPESTANEVLDFVEFLENRLFRLNKNEKFEQLSENGWPDCILSFEGIPEMPPFEQDRHLLHEPSEDPLA